jgi:hypothetical protein
MSTAVPLKLIWEPVVVTLGLQDRENLEQFFRHTLVIGDVTNDDILKELGDLSELCKDDPAYSPELEFIHEMYQRLDRLRKEMDQSNLRDIKYVPFLFAVACTLSLHDSAATNVLSGRPLKRTDSYTLHQISPSGGSKSPSVSGRAKEPYLARLAWNRFTQTSLGCLWTISGSQS